MSAGELETLVRLNIRAVLIHFNNACFGWIKALQAMHTRDKFFSVDFSTGDPAKVAEGFGMEAHRITSPDMLDSALENAFSTDGPVFLDVVTESEVTALPPVYSWIHKLNGNTKGFLEKETLKNKKSDMK
jgi:acetolactate synthase-1/2/3 large subunit